MQAIQCDKCGALQERKNYGFIPEMTKDISGDGWRRDLEHVTVRLTIAPLGDPKGFGGLDLCELCINALVESAAKAFVGATKQASRRTR
jgi:hypothetical protein